MHQQRRYSLRRNYLLISTVISLIIVGTTILSSFDVARVSSENAKAIKLQESVSSIIYNIRRNTTTTYTLLSELLISPSNSRNANIKDFIASNELELARLKTIKQLDETGLAPYIERLNKSITQMNANIREMQTLRKDSQWVYPVLTIMNRDMFSENIRFTSAIELVLHTLNDKTTLNQEDRTLFNTLVALRDTWRIMVLNFRAVLLRFAGLNQVDKAEQEKNITVILNEINTHLDWLQKKAANDRFDLDIEEAIENMVDSHQQWIFHFNRFRTLRESAIWRNDVFFTTKNIRPYYEETINIIENIDQSISQWAKRNSRAVESTAYEIILELILLSTLAIGFVILIYIMLNKLMLGPIARISDSLSKESHGDEFVLPKYGSKEVFNLISAYNRMRELIQQRQRALEHQALHDALTGLPNRALLQDRLIHSIRNSDRHNNTIAFMLIDLDRFKEINDTLGHQIGDRVLTSLGRRLQQCIRKSDTIARLGGDEFALVVPGVNAEEARHFADKLTNTINAVLNIDGQNLFIDASIGIALYPDNSDDADTLIRYADIAMYHAKKANQNYALFNPDMDQLSVDNLALLSDFRQELSLQTGQLQLFYQPKINLLNKSVVSVEALLRWEHPQQGFVPPEFLIRMSEQSGIIGELTTWVINQAISDCATWQADNVNIGVSINLSAWNLQDPKLPELITASLQRNQLHPSFLSLEITESAVMSDPARAREVMNELDDMGLSLEIDDYGTGFSSLAYLKLLPVSTLKIDKSFVMDMLNDPNDLIIVRSTIELAHNLGMTVIAEGVENTAILDDLRSMRCDIAQGYYISKPVPKDKLLQWYKDYNQEKMTA